jgi:hypothetical protein
MGARLARRRARDAPDGKTSMRFTAASVNGAV